MYQVPHFKAEHEQQVFDFMEQNPFVVICGVNEHQQPVATHVPILIEWRNDQLFLLGHIMRKQDHTNTFEKNNQVLVIFSGNHSYVSATNYAEQNTASTWNYKAVHASGNLKFLDEAALLNLLTKLTKHFENNEQSPALVEKMKPEYIQPMLKAIVAFEINVTALDHVFKLSQNKDEATKKKIIQQLENDKNPLSDDMKNFYKKD